MVRQFGLINENGQEFSLMDIENFCLLTEPDGLGMTYSTEYEKVGNAFLENIRTLEQGRISGILNFINYDNYRKFIDFVEFSEELRFHYIVPYKNQLEYYRDVKLAEISKSELQPNGILSQEVMFDCTSLWYSINIAKYVIQAQEDELRWDFNWNPRFISYSARNLTIVNDGHAEATISLEIDGEIANPEITLLVEGTEVQNIPFVCQIEEHEKFMYSSKDGNSYVKKRNADGTYTDLFNLTVLTFDNNNVLKLPKGKSCEIQVTATTDISSAILQVYIYYKSV